ncbi:MAG TPA: protein kinase [Chloroflexi bacterium]|nr:protein kinase [Chloroflexota bacterium]
MPSLGTVGIIALEMDEKGLTGILPLGKTIGGRYEILEVLERERGRARYLARDNRFQGTTRLCIVEEMINLIFDATTSRRVAAAFERKVNTLASLNHPAIPTIYDYFQEGRRSYLVFGRGEGKDLETIIEEADAGLPEAQLLTWAIQICDLLSCLHKRQPPLVFRHLELRKIVVKEDGHLMLIDLDIVETSEEQDRMKGTPGYTAPERYQGVAEPASDIYALGAIIYHLLTGRDPRKDPPFTFHERPPRQLNPSISPEVEAMVMKALEYKSEDRYRSAEEMQKELLAAQKERTPPLVVQREPRGVISPLWSFACGDEVRSSPAVAGGILSVGSYDRNLYALNAQRGEPLWEYATQGGIASSPLVADDLVFFGSEDNLFYALHMRTGRIKWSLSTQGRIRSSPRLAYEHLFFGSDDQIFYALRARTGRIAWRFDAEAPIRSSAAISGGTLFFGDEEGYLYALDAASGEVKWKYQAGGKITSSPAVEEDLILVGCGDSHIYALDLEKGGVIWRYRTEGPIISSPAVAKGVVYIGSIDHRLYALEAKTGKPKWYYSTEEAVTSSPRLAEGAVYFGSIDGHLYCLDAQSGELRWRFQTEGPISGSPTISEGIIYIGSLDHKVYALPIE